MEQLNQVNMVVLSLCHRPMLCFLIVSHVLNCKYLLSNKTG